MRERTQLGANRSPEVKTGILRRLTAVALASLALAACTSIEKGEPSLHSPAPATSVAHAPSIETSVTIPTPDAPPTNITFLTNAPGERPFKYEVDSYGGEDTVVAKKPGDYIYGPSAMKTADGKWRVWYCGGGGSGLGDSIWYSENSEDGITSAWSPRIEAVKPSSNSSYLDSVHACDPSVVKIGRYYYVSYTGATDWGPNGGSCIGSPTADGCDNRIFLARVLESNVGNGREYEKLANIGDCALMECLDWSKDAPPIPVIRSEIDLVWRKAGTGTVGTTTQQTHAYGTGQPSVVIADGKIHVWSTLVTEKSASVNLAVKPTVVLGNPFAIQDQNSYIQKIVSNDGNEVNYKMAYVDKIGNEQVGRYLAIISEEHPDDPTSRLSTPRIALAIQPGSDTSLMHAPIISNSLRNNTGPNAYIGTRTNTHNSGVLRDENGHLVLAPGHKNGASYYWALPSTNRNNMPGSFIIREPFLLEPQK